MENKYKEALKRLILTVNCSKPFDTMDVDNPAFVDYICEKTGLSQEDYEDIVLRPLES